MQDKKLKKKITKIIIVAIGAIHNNLFLNIFILLITSLLDNVLNISHVVYYNM